MAEPFELTPAAVDRLIAAVGVEHVLLGQAERDEFRDPFWFEGDRSYDSSAVVLPATTAQVQEVVRIAAEYGIPLWTSSQGRNNGYGGPAGRVRGCVLVSLRRMNRVIEIDRELAYAVVEPGVRWFDLRDALDASGDGDLWFSVPDLGWGSVIGNSLDNGTTYAPNGSDFQKLCGMEVVLADGSLLRTGMGALPGSGARHVYPRGFGPVLDPLFLQSNYGIVTQVGIWLMRRPQAFAPLFLTVPRHEQLAQAVDIVRELRLDGIIRGVPSFQNTITMTAQFDEFRDRYYRFDPPMPEERLQGLADETGLGRWGLRTALWNDTPVVEHQLGRVREAWSAVEGGRVDSKRVYARDEWDQITAFLEKVQAGIPSQDIIAATPAGVGHLAFSPVVALRGAEVAACVDFARKVVTERMGRNFVSAIFVINDRSCIIVNSLGLRSDDPVSTRRAVETIRYLIPEAAKHGWGEYRAHIHVMDEVQEQYAWGGHAYRRFTETLKDALDPEGILSPGRNGIWPARYRA